MKNFCNTFCCLALSASLLFSANIANATDNNSNFPKDLSPIKIMQNAIGVDEANTKKIEIFEFFSYACSHCNDFSPKLNAWTEKNKNLVEVKKMPVSFNRTAMKALAKLHYALQTVGKNNPAEAKIFDAVFSRKNIYNENAAAEWLKTQGWSDQEIKDFKVAYNSFGVNSLVSNSDKLAQTFDISGTPTLVVAGKYVIETTNFDQVLKTADFLVNKIQSKK